MTKSPTLKTKEPNYLLLSLLTVLKYINRHPSYWVSAFVRSVYIALEVSVPILLGIIINKLTLHQTSVEDLAIPVGLFVTFTLVGPLLEVSTGIYSWISGVRTSIDFRQDTIKNLEFAGLGFWQRNQRGGTMQVMNRAAEAMLNVTAMLTHSYLWYIGRVMGIFFTSLFITPFILVVLVIDMILFFINLRITMKKESDAALAENKTQEEMYSGINEYLQNYKTITYLNLFKKQEREIALRQHNHYRKYVRREVFSFFKWYNNNQLHHLAILAIFSYGLWETIQGHLQIGSFATLLFFSIGFAENLGMLVWNTSQLVTYTNNFKRYFQVFGEIQVQPQAEPVNLGTFRTLSFTKVSYVHQDIEALNGVSFTLKQKQKMAIVGYSGSGKSTLLDITLKVLTDYDGSIKINGKEYQDLKVQDITQIFTIVPQEVQLFKDSIKNNILAGKSQEDVDLQKLITVTNLTGLVAKLPQGLDSEISEGSLNVSGGERQRIGIARALAQQKPVMVLDEATASLDPKTEREVISNLVHNYPDLTIIYVTHKYSLLNLFDTILVLNDGKIVEQGSFDQLKAKGGLFTDLFNASQVA